MRHQFATVHELARIEMLAGRPGETLVRLAERMIRRPLEPGDALLASEDDRGRFWVVVSGMLSAPGRMLRPGDTLGGLTLFDEPVRAVLPSTVVSCDRETFEELIRPVLPNA